MMLKEVSLTEVDWRLLSKKLLIAALIGGCFALVFEADHTSDLPILAAFGLWFTHILFAAALFLAALWAFQRFGFRHPLPTVASALLLPALFAPISLLLDYGFGNPDDELVSAEPAITIYLSEVVAVAPVALAVALVVAFLLRREAPSQDEQKEIAAPSLRSMFGAVPPSLGNDIIRAHAQDHYVEVVTTKGSALLTAQFSGCVKKLEQLDGIQCHRSHWVSLAHVREVARSGSAYICTLSNGDEVPVSRRRYSELKDRMGMRSPAS